MRDNRRMCTSGIKISTGRVHIRARFSHFVKAVSDYAEAPLRNSRRAESSDLPIPDDPALS